MVDSFSLVLGGLLIAVALGLGATLCVADFIHCIQTKKRAVGIGFTCQFGIMPLIAYSYARAFGVSDPIAIGMILTGCAPGGTTSNLLTYWSKGSVALSITMSAASTLASLGMLPLLIIIYIGSTYESDDLEIPFLNIFLSLTLLILPCLFGIYTKSTSDKWAKRLEKGGSAVGAIFLVVALIWGISENHELFSSGFAVWWASGTLQLVGSAVGYSIAWSTSLSRRDQRTIALETGLQNSALIIALIGISYDDTPARKDILAVPLLYSLFLVFHSAWLTAFFRLYVAPGDSEEDVKEAAEEEAEMEHFHEAHAHKDGDAAAEKDAADAVPIKELPASSSTVSQAEQSAV